MEKKQYNPIELMACIASRYLEDGRLIFAGTGIPMLAVSLAQKIYAPNLILVYEAGGISPEASMLPLSVADSRTTYRAICCANMPEAMEMLQKGLVTYAFLGGAQIDMYGNLNSTMIGKDYWHPQTRLPGSGGANELGSLAWKTLIIMNHNRRRFVEKVDFITTPGYLTGPGARERACLPPGNGPHLVFTELGIFDFEEKSKRMRLKSLLPGITREKVIAETGFELIISDKLNQEKEPTPEELKALREDVDPWRVVLSRGDNDQ
ncbi:MAG: Glutaconate CoA-transferase subunit B [Smithella sp. PtaU1.Bin162]|nr:MAG: Glutaconate CoA-transferase subunit B [Smithella sp. PtaU1.Bin162]